MDDINDINEEHEENIFKEACKNGDIEKIKSMINKNYIVTGYFEACSNEQIEVMKLLEEYIEENEILDTGFNFGCISGKLETVKHITEIFEDLYGKLLDKYFFDPSTVTNTLENGHYDIIDYLFKENINDIEDYFENYPELIRKYKEHKNYVIT